MKKALLYIGGTIGFLILGVVGCTALLSEGIDGAIEESEAASERDEQIVVDATTITNCGLEDGFGAVSVEFVNPLEEEKGFISIEINFLSDDDTVIGSASFFLENVGAGQKAVESSTFNTIADGFEIASCEVADGSIS